MSAGLLARPEIDRALCADRCRNVLRDFTLLTPWSHDDVDARCGVMLYDLVHDHGTRALALDLDGDACPRLLLCQHPVLGCGASAHDHIAHRQISVANSQIAPRRLR